MKEPDFKPAYNALAAKIMFEDALSRGDMAEARAVAQVCVDAQEKQDERP
jgi:hypothetical protein